MTALRDAIYSGEAMGMGLQRRTGRRIAALAAGALSVAMLTGAIKPVRADGDSLPGQRNGAVKNPMVDIELVEARLQDALNVIKQRTGIDHVLLPSDGKYRKITLSLTGRPVDVTLKQIALAAGADFWQEGGIYFFGPKGSAPKAPELVATLPEYATPAPVRYRYEKIKMMYSSAKAVVHKMLTPYQDSADPMDKYREDNFKRFLNSQGAASIHSQFDTTGGSGSSVAPYTPTGGSRTESSPVRPNFSQFNSSGGDQTSHRDGPDGGSNLGGGIIERAGQFPGGGGGGGGFPGGGGGFGGGGFQGGGGGPQGPGGAGQGAGGAQGGQANGLLPPGLPPGNLYAQESDNSIIYILPDTPEAETIKADLLKVIRLLDIKPRQINIKAEFITVSSNTNNSFGINWNFQKVNLIGGASTGFSQTSTAFLQYATGNLQTALSFILTNGYGKIFASPSATTLNGVNVQFFQTTSQPVFLTQPVVTNGGTTVLTSQIQIINATTGISVTPILNGDGSISLNGFVISSAVGAPITGPNGESFPNITTQNAPIQTIVRNGETMVIAGLNSKNDTVSSNKVPILGDLPFIGTLFKSRTVSTNDQELYVFITALLIPERTSNNAIGGGVLKDSGSGPAITPGGGL